MYSVLHSIVPHVLVTVLVATRDARAKALDPTAPNGGGGMSLSKSSKQSGVLTPRTLLSLHSTAVLSTARTHVFHMPVTDSINRPRRP